VRLLLPLTTNVLPHKPLGLTQSLVAERFAKAISTLKRAREFIEIGLGLLSLVIISPPIGIIMGTLIVNLILVKDLNEYSQMVILSHGGLIIALVFCIIFS
jgi:hypothetical protein